MPSSTSQGIQITADRRSGWLMRCVCEAAVLAAMATWVAVAQQAPKSTPDQQSVNSDANRNPDKKAPIENRQQVLTTAAPDQQGVDSDANRTPDNSVAMNAQPAPLKPAVDSAHPESSKAAYDSEQLLQLATDLKKEVDKTNKDTLSVDVIRKAEMIQKLARGVKEKIKAQDGAS